MKKLVVVSALLAKAHYDSFTKKDGTFVQAHDDKRAAAKPKQAAHGGYSVAPFKHGGHQIKEPGGKHHVILQDKGVADRHAGALNHVAQAGKDAHMNESIHAAAKKHMGLDSFDEVGSDREDFVDTGKTGLKRALHDAYDAGAGHSNGGAHRDAVVAEAGKHFGQFDTLDEAGHDGADFKEVSKGLLKHALKHAYASGAQKGGASPKMVLPKKKPASGAMGPDEVKQHAVAAGAKFRSNVSVFSKPELAHSFANQTQGSKGSAFVMKHPDHQHHVVVGGADAQRMEKNGYQHVRPGA